MPAVMDCDLNLTEPSPMTDDMMSLRARIGKAADAELLRKMIGFAAQRLMELGIGELT